MMLTPRDRVSPRRPPRAPARTLARCLLLAASLSLLPGCAGLFAKKAIQRFAASMQEQDLAQLRETTSQHFEEKALRQPEAAKDLKFLRIPDGKIEIVSLEKIDETTQKAIVKVGEKDRARKIEYRLARHPKTGRWVVDDVILAQDTGLGDPVQRSVTEQMDLLLTCREFLVTWKDGKRTEKLAFCDDRLRSELETLPPKWFGKLSADLVGSGRQRNFRPEARMNGDRAVVVVPHPEGSLFLELKQTGENWLVHDLAIEPTSENSTGIRSLTKMSQALNRSARFLGAYASGNREGLEEAASTKFYHQCLAGADLESIPVPVPALLAADYRAKQFSDRIELLLGGEATTYMLTLRYDETPKGDGTTAAPAPRVDEVTLFDDDGSEVKRLSAMFSSHAVVHLFMEALLQRDLTQLQELSSANFNERVWSQDFSRHFTILPYPELDEGEPEILSTVFHGDVTEVTIAQGETPMTFVLRLGRTRGWMVVDDVVLPALDRPTSLKSNLELLLPLYSFASAARRDDLRGLIRESGEGLDRIVWLQMREVPETARQLVRPLMSEVVAIERGEPWTIVRTSDGETAAEVRLVREGKRHVVHDVLLVSETNPDQRLDFMQAMRQQIADGQMNALPHRRPVQQAGGFAPAAPGPSTRQAPFEPIERAVYSQPD